MKFQPGDMIETLCDGEVAENAWITKGMRGTVLQWHGETDRYDPPGRYWECEFSGQPVCAHEDYIRKVPPDPGREVREWDECVWQPGVTA